MKRLLTVFVLLTGTLLNGCDKSHSDRSETRHAEKEVFNSPQAISLQAVAELAKNGSAAHETLDSICPRVNPDAVLVNNLTVGLVSDVGSIDDGTFNQAAFSGMEAAGRCFGLVTTFLESAGDDAASQIQSLVDRKVDIIVAVGFQFQDATIAAVKAQPELRFIGVDQVNLDKSSNYVAISFRDDQVGFLAGAMAGLMTKSNTVGVIAGPDSIPPVVAIADGFEAGARHVSPEAIVLKQHLDSFNDPQAGSAQASAFIDKGADVVFGAAGETGTGATRVAAASGAYVIGVDQDEYYTTFSGGMTLGAKRLVTSAIKRVDLGVFLALSAMSLGGIEGGDFLLDASNGGVTYAPFHMAEVPDTVAQQIETLRRGLANGEIDALVPLTDIQHSKYD